MEDLWDNADSGRLLTAALASGKPLAIVCHAPAAMLATRRKGVSPFAGYNVTGAAAPRVALGDLAVRSRHDDYEGGDGDTQRDVQQQGARARSAQDREACLRAVGD